MNVTLRRLIQGIILGAVCVTGAAVTLHAWSNSSLVKRRGRVVDDLPPYGDELRTLDPYAESPSCEPLVSVPEAYLGSGWYRRPTPNGKFVAVTTSWGPPLADILIGFVIDRPFYHTVEVWNRASGSSRAVVSIKESDPRSGIAHRYAWSQDSRALLILGSGRLPEDYDAVVELCLVYLPTTDELYRLAHCPPLWQRAIKRDNSDSGCGGCRRTTGIWTPPVK